jgi:hypothetical protein
MLEDGAHHGVDLPVARRWGAGRIKRERCAIYGLLIDFAKRHLTKMPEEENKEAALAAALHVGRGIGFDTVEEFLGGRSVATASASVNVDPEVGAPNAVAGRLAWAG